ncbi:MAG: hypothetical protein KDC05_13495 [Bacteroidales bacterium]|nr:hypothetical protein [Bacteroidales bacterium]
MKYLIWPSLILILISCSGNKRTENVLARVYNDYLYESEIGELVPPGTNPKDSISLVKNYVNNWVSEKLFLQKAEKNLHDEDLLFEKQLEQYRNSLIIYAYESKLITQNLDTSVSQTEIEQYYNDNLENFQLKDNIVKVYYARFDGDIDEMKKIRKFFYAESEEARDSLDTYIEEYSDLYFLDNETWILFDDVLKYVPINTYNKEAYLQNNRKIEITEEGYVFLVNFTDFKIKDGISPLSFEKETIRQIILNKRKLRIINNMREEVFNSALENNDFEIY